MDKRVLTDAEVERSIALQLQASRDGNDSDLREMLGDEAIEAYKRLRNRLLPELVRWQAGELNRGTAAAMRLMATGTFIGWIIASDSRNSNDPALAAQLQTSLVVAMARLFGGADLVDDATLNPRATPKTS